MTRLSSIVVALVICATAILSAQKVRTLPWLQPIEPALLPDDEVVLIPCPGIVTPAPPYIATPDIELKQLARWEEIAVIDQPRSQSFLVNNGSWLNTRIQARVVQSLKTGRLATTRGAAIEFEHEGGELDIRGVTVRSECGVYFEQATRYLVGFMFRPDLKKWQLIVMFEIDKDDVLRPRKLRSESASPNALHGMALTTVANAISKAAK